MLGCVLGKWTGGRFPPDRETLPGLLIFARNRGTDAWSGGVAGAPVDSVSNIERWADQWRDAKHTAFAL